MFPAIAASFICDFWDFLTRSKDSFGSIESILTSAAILVGGGWAFWVFVWKREKAPKAQIRHEVKYWDYDPDERLLRVSLVIENKGNALLKISDGQTWIQQIKPWPHEEIKAFKARSKTPKDAPYEVNWPFAGETDVETIHNKPRELEPGESDEICMDFFIKKTYDVVLVYSYVENTAKGDKHVGWTVSTIVDLKRAAEGVSHTVEAQSQSKPRPIRTGH
jgi:hypothetical protein